jgi:hypothetical protein
MPTAAHKGGGDDAETKSLYLNARSGFMIMDNALHALEHGTSPDSSFCSYKLDISKSYDRVD